MMSSALKRTSLEDLKAGSVLEAFLDAEAEMRQFKRRTDLVKFLSKLDNRFKKYDYHQYTPNIINIPLGIGKL